MVAHIFTLLMEPFAFIFLNYSSHNEILNFGKISKLTTFSFEKSDLTVSRIIDQYGRKRYQKKRKDLWYQLLPDFFSKIFCCK